MDVEILRAEENNGYVRNHVNVIKLCCQDAEKMELVAIGTSNKNISIEIGYDGGETLGIKARYCPCCGTSINILRVIKKEYEG